MPETIEKRSPALDERRPVTDRLAIPSEKRLKANRENARKSTGPRTQRGKAYSRRNAIKHGLFARPAIDFLLQNERWSEYRNCSRTYARTTSLLDERRSSKLSASPRTGGDSSGLIGTRTLQTALQSVMSPEKN